MKQAPRGAWARPFHALREDERGISLVLALLIVAALSISTAALAQLVSSNEHAFGRDRQETRAFNSAEAGLNYAISSLAKTVDPNGNAAVNTSSGTSASPNLYPAGTGPGGWWATKTTAYIWTIWATGTSPTGKVIRELSVHVKSKTAPGTITPASLAWSYGLFVANPTSCFSPIGSSALTISVYVNGDMCLGGGGSILEPPGPGSTIKVYAKGKITLAGSSSIGVSGKPIALLTALQGCFPAKGIQCSNTPTSKVWATTYAPTGPPITKPTIDPDATYNSGDWKNPVCTTGSFTFDNNAARNNSVLGVNLFPGSSYICSVHAPGDPSNIIGTLAWNAATNLLTVTGTIYIDGDLSIGSNLQARYGIGTLGTIYINGVVTTNGGSTLCGPPATPNGSTCLGKWNGALGSLVIVAVNSQGAGTGWKMNGNAEYDVGAYVVGDYNNGGGAFVTGPVITDTASVGGSSSSTDVSNPPPTAPGGSSTSPGTTSWAVVPNTWQQCLIAPTCT